MNEVISSRKSITLTVIAALLIISVVLTGCTTSHSLTGHYTSESGRYEIKFEPDGDCKWYQDGRFFEGEYNWEEDEGVYVLEIKGSGLYLSTIFKAEPAGKNCLIVTGGRVNGERFTK